MKSSYCFSLFAVLAACGAEAPSRRGAVPVSVDRTADPSGVGSDDAGAPGVAAYGSEADQHGSAPAGVFDVAGGGCPPVGAEADALCMAARALPLTPTLARTKLDGRLPLPGGKVRNRSGKDVYAVGSVGGGLWEILRIPAGTSTGGDLVGEAPHMTRDIDWVSPVPPVSDLTGAFTYAPSSIGVKVSDGGELTVQDRPGGGVRFDITAAPLVRITSAGQMNGGARIVYQPSRAGHSGS